MIAGVCGGLAEYLDIDSAIIRLIWVIFLFAGGAGFWAYIVAWIIIPENPDFKREEVNMNEKVKMEKTEEAKIVDPAVQAKKEKRSYLLGLVLIILGAIFLANNFLPALRFDKLWPLIFVAVGLTMIFSSKRE